VVGLLHRLDRSPLGRFCAKLIADRAMVGAVQIAWQAMYSSFPLILGLLGLFGLFLRDPGQRLRLAEAVASQFPSQVGDLLGFIEETRELGGLLGAASLVGLIWSGYWLFQTLELVFNHFYGAPDRGLRQRIVMALAMIGLYAVLFSLSVLASTAASLVVTASSRVAWLDLGGVDPLIGWAVALASAVAMFASVYRVVPNTPLGLRDVWPGALLAGVLFVALSQAFPLYLRVLGGGYAAYKTLGLFLVLMTWFYCLAIILVLGAELNAFLGGRPGAATDRVAAMQVLIAGPTAADGSEPSGGPVPGSGRSGRRRVAGGQRHDEARPAALAGLRVEPPAV
jgi:membrane protein